MAEQPIVDVTEHKRLNEAREAGTPWKKWWPYLSERQWCTVREDYSRARDGQGYHRAGEPRADRPKRSTTDYGRHVSGGRRRQP
jgi:hypothetical protein